MREILLFRQQYLVASPLASHSCTFELYATSLKVYELWNLQRPTCWNFFCNATLM